MLKYQGILSYQVYHEKGCIRKEVCVSGSIIVERALNYRFWSDKAKDAA